MRGPRQGGWRAALAGWATLAAACGADERQAGLGQPELPTGLALDDVARDTGGAEGVATGDGAGDGEVASGTKLDGEACVEDAECASAFCLFTRSGRACASRCDAVACALGRECRSVPAGAEGDVVAVCVDRFASLCLPCRAHEDCALNGDATARCRAAGDATLGRFCATACGEGQPPCPTGFTCDDAQCVPTAGAGCTCTALAVTLAATTECGRAGAGGAVCDGTRRCETAGATSSACDAATPGAEACNGVDDDCDGATDEGPLTPDCGAYACAGAAGCFEVCDDPVHCAPGLGCEGHACIATGADGSPCAAAEDCDHGYCSNGHCCAAPTNGGDRLCCAEDADCAALAGHAACDVAATCQGTSVVGRCQDAVCVAVKVADSAACAGATCHAAACEASGGGTAWHGPSLCDPNGSCVATGPEACNDQLACTTDTCSAAQGCAHAALNGTIGAACYGFEAATRGVGECRDGNVVCAAGEAADCAFDEGPGDEACDGLDNDCDGATDEETAAECYPYRCEGVDGCGWACGGDAGCAEGAYCDGLGECASMGDDGSYCDSDAACKSGNCDNGACCSGGTCCHDDTDCWMYDDAACDDAKSCAGHVDTGTCGADFVCTARTESAPDACAGEVCGGEPKCDGSVLVEADVCGPDGLCGVVNETTSCAPYGCRDGGCLQVCANEGDCAAGSKCSADGKCLLPNGAACERSGDCAGQRCNNGFCCSSGTCCAEDGDCAALGDDGTCTDPEGCRGTQTVATCGASSSCETATVETSAPCIDVACKSAECQNLSGGTFFKEGVLRGVCDAGGDCREETRDCRDLSNTAFCGNATSYPLCANCSAARATCIVLGLQCRCE